LGLPGKHRQRGFCRHPQRRRVRDFAAGDRPRAGHDPGGTHSQGSRSALEREAVRLAEGEYHALLDELDRAYSSAAALEQQG